MGAASLYLPSGPHPGVAVCAGRASRRAGCSNSLLGAHTIMRPARAATMRNGARHCRQSPVGCRQSDVGRRMSPLAARRRPRRAIWRRAHLAATCSGCTLRLSQSGAAEGRAFNQQARRNMSAQSNKSQSNNRHTWPQTKESFQSERAHRKSARHFRRSDIVSSAMTPRAH